MRTNMIYCVELSLVLENEYLVLKGALDSGIFWYGHLGILRTIFLWDVEDFATWFNLCVASPRFCYVFIIQLEVRKR